MTDLETEWIDDRRVLDKEPKSEQFLLHKDGNQVQSCCCTQMDRTRVTVRSYVPLVPVTKYRFPLLLVHPGFRVPILTRAGRI